MHGYDAAKTGKEARTSMTQNRSKYLGLLRSRKLVESSGQILTILKSRRRLTAIIWDPASDCRSLLVAIGDRAYLPPNRPDALLAVSWAPRSICPVLTHSAAITPDVSLVLLTLAGLSYLMPELINKIENNRGLRIAVAVVLISFGLTVIVLNEWERLDQEQREDDATAKLNSVAVQNNRILQTVLSEKTITELERRKRIEDVLRNEYVLSHSNVSPAMLDGNEYPRQIG